MVLKSNPLKFKYKNSLSIQYPSLTMKKGEQYLILGKSGSGKTTFLHLLCGFLTPDEGSIQLDGKNFSDLPEQKKDKLRGKCIGIIYQESHFLNALSVWQNVQVAVLAANKKFDKDYVTSLFNTLDLNDKIHKQPNELSVGEQQRVNIIRALAHKPMLLFADEPTSALDDENCYNVISVLLEASRINNTALAIVTHDQRLKTEFKNVINL